MSGADLLAIAPLWIVAATAALALALIAVRRSHAATAGLTVAGLLVALICLPLAQGPRRVTDLVWLDSLSLAFLALLFVAALVVVALAYVYLQQHEEPAEELYVLLLLATAGAAVVVVSNHFASFFIGLETLSVSLYGLIAYRRGSPGAIEAGLKYVVLAGASSAVLLFGMALLYLVVGSMSFFALARQLSTMTAQPLVVAGAGLIFVGIGFKLALVPFHMWTPDVYQGAPMPIAAFVATVSKGAMLAVFLRLAAAQDLRSAPQLLLVLTVVAAASMLLGNLLALLQRNVKRLLAYSSISHLGYALVALLGPAALARRAVAYYAVAYVFSLLAAFSVLTFLSQPQREAESIDDVRGLFWSRPLLAATLSVGMLSLAGIPLTAGFVAKFYAASAGIVAARWVLVSVLIATSAIGLYYYLRVVVAMFASEPPALATPSRPTVYRTAAVALPIVLLAMVLLVGLWPEPVFNLVDGGRAREATASSLP